MDRLTMAERARLYHAASKIYRPLDVVPTADGGRLEGLWLLGNNYRGSGYHGAFPPGFLMRVRALFPDARRVLHLFSGSLPPGDYLRVDINPAVRPDVVGDAQRLSGFLRRRFDLVVADPPYTGEDAVRYGTIMICRRQVLREVHAVLEPGGYLVWLDQVWPAYRKDTWYLRGLIGVARSVLHRARLVTILERRE